MKEGKERRMIERRREGGREGGREGREGGMEIRKEGYLRRLTQDCR